VSAQQLLFLFALLAGELVRWVTVTLVLVQLKRFARMDAVHPYFSSNSTGFVGMFWSRNIGLGTPNVPYFIFQVMTLVMSNNAQNITFQLWEKTSVHL
jgi:hypothetical protein